MTPLQGIFGASLSFIAVSYNIFASLQFRDVSSSIFFPTMALFSRTDCGSDPAWQATVTAYNGANCDSQLAQWWGQQQHGSFANTLAKSFGSEPTNFECGIGDESSCSVAGCQPFQAANNPIWPYLVLVSLENLSNQFNNIYNSIGNSQQTYTNLIDSIATTFFPWKDPQFPLGAAAPWLTAILSIIFSFMGPEGAAMGSLAGQLASAAINEVTVQEQPTPGGVLLADTTVLGDNLATWGSQTRDSIDEWANTTFNGGTDQVGNTILNYLQNGAFVDATILPSAAKIESSYTQQLISRTVNSQWKTKKIFVTFTETSDPNDSSGPPETKYYSAEDGGVYYTYYYSEDGILKGHLDKPFGLDALNGALYNISGSDITKASAAAYRVAKFNFTHADEMNQLEAAFSSKETVSPFEQGAGWVGTWTLPVCDMGANNWNTAYGAKPTRFGLMPCCCGQNCSETKDFIKAANMQGFQTVLHACQAQLQKTSINYADVDYGIKWKRSYPLRFAAWNIWQKGLSVLACIVSLGLAIPILWFA